MVKVTHLSLHHLAIRAESMKADYLELPRLLALWLLLKHKFSCGDDVISRNFGYREARLNRRIGIYPAVRFK